MSIANDKIVNLQDAKVLYDDLRGRIEDTNTYEKTISEANAIQTFEDGANWPMRLQVAVDPVQDLHGYSNPWPGGGGKNLLPLTIDGIKAANTSRGSWNGNAFSWNGVTYTINTDADGNVKSITVNGTATEATEINLISSNTYFLPAGDYIISGGISNSVRLWYYNGTSYYNSMGSETSFTVSGSETTSRYVISVPSGSSASNAVVYPMIRLSTVSDATFEPYTNICPITGWTGANVTVSGENHAAGITTHNGAINATTGVVTDGSNTRLYSDFIVVDPGTYVIFTKPNLANVIRAYSLDGTYGVDGYTGDGSWNANGRTVTFTKSCKIRIMFAYNMGQQIEISPEDVEEIFVCENATVYPITFPTSAGTVYGGNLTVNKDGTGTLVVTHESLTPTASDYNWNRTYNIVNFSLNAKYQVVQTPICNAFNGVSAKTAAEIASSYPGCCATSVGLKFININSNFATLEEFKAYATTNPITFVLKLATPITYTLSAPQVLSLIGKNHVWADTGDILSLTYNSKQGMEFIREDTAGQIAPVKAELDSAESAMAIIVDGDTSPSVITAGKYVFLKNHSTLPSGLYHVTAYINSGDTISASNVGADADGGLNAMQEKIGAVGSTDLQTQVTTLNSKITTITYNVLNPLNGYFTKRNAFRAKIRCGVAIVESYINITTEIPTNTEFASIETTGIYGSYIAINTSTRAVYYVALRSTGRFASETAIPTGYYYFVGCAI